MVVLFYEVVQEIFYFGIIIFGVLFLFVYLRWFIILLEFQLEKIEKEERYNLKVVFFFFVIIGCNCGFYVKQICVYLKIMGFVFVKDVDVDK